MYTRQNARSRVALFLLAAALALAGLLPASARAERPILEAPGTGIFGTALASPELKPAWTFRVDNNPHDGSAPFASIAEDNLVLTFVNRKLVALQASIGKKRWTYGTGLQPVLAYEKGRVYGLDGEGRVYALRASDGKRLWLSRVGGADEMVPLGDRVYVAHGTNLHALDGATGKRLWTATVPSAVGPGYGLVETDGVVLRKYTISGAITFSSLEAFDRKTGKHLWSLTQDLPLLGKDGLIYSVEGDWPVPDQDLTPERSLTLSLIEPRTGSIQDSRVFRWTIPGQPPYVEGNKGAFVHGDSLYVYQHRTVVRYRLEDAGEAKPLEKWTIPENARPLYKLHGDRLLFQDMTTGGLVGVKTVNGQTIRWNGDNPAYRVDLFDKFVAIAQTDGKLHVLDYASAKPLFQVRTDSRTYGPTLKTGNMLIIQAKDRLIGVKLPAKLS